jgi:hypothetical protein
MVAPCPFTTLFLSVLQDGPVSYRHCKSLYVQLCTCVNVILCTEDGGLPLCFVQGFSISTVAAVGKAVPLDQSARSQCVVEGLLMPVVDEGKAKGKREFPFWFHAYFVASPTYISGVPGAAMPFGCNSCPLFLSG